MDKPQVVRREMLENITDPEKGTTKLGTYVEVVLRVSDDGSVGGLTVEDVDALRLLAEKYDDDADNFETTGPVAVWLEKVATVISDIIQAAQGVEG